MGGGSSAQRRTERFKEVQNLAHQAVDSLPSVFERAHITDESVDQLRSILEELQTKIDRLIQDEGGVGDDRG